MRLRDRLWAVSALATAAAIVAAAPAPAASRPDLKVSKGSVHASGGRLSGSFVVRNRGRAPARRSSALLWVGTPEKGRTAGRFRVPALETGETKTVKVDVRLPRGLASGSRALRACADGRSKVRERFERNNCRRIGTVKVRSSQPEGSTRPTDPVPFSKNTVFTLDSPQSNYWVYVPDAYDETHATPIKLLVWLHGCGGQSAGDIYTVSPGGAQSYIAIAVGGREGQCWDPGGDQGKVLAAIANVESHFNIDNHQVVLGGYSSGGWLAYRTAFYNAKTFAGVLAEDTSPVSGTGSSLADSIAAAAWKFNIVHLAHTEDATFPIAQVRADTDALKAAGFAVTRIERPGTHYDESTPTSGTDHDLQTLLLPHLNDGWRSP